MLGPTIYIPSGLARLLIPLTSSRGRMLPDLSSALKPVTDHRLGETDRVWRSGCGLTCCTA